MHPRSGPRRLPYPVGAVCAALLLAACSSSAGKGSGGDGTEPEVTATPAMLKTAGLSFPLDAYEATAQEKATLNRAQSALQTQCMARYGFSYTPPKAPAGNATSVANAQIFGVVDPEVAEQYGYSSAKDVNPPVKAAKANLTESESLALSGEPDLVPDDMPMSQAEAEKEGGGKRKINGEAVPLGGCIRESYLKLYAPKPGVLDPLYVFNLKSEAESSTREDSRVKAVNKRWSDCMAESGLSASDPMDAGPQLGFSGGTLSTAAAITAAKADVACKKRGNLVGVYFAVTSAYQNRLLDQNAETFDLARQQLDDRLKLAATLSS